MTTTLTTPGDAALTDFSYFVHEHDHTQHQVYAIGDTLSPPVLVMHELPGLTTTAFDFARRLSGERFRVYLPHLFGKLLEADARGNYRKLCVSREFGNLAAGVSAPITCWLRSLALRLSDEHRGANVGAIGMCLTGGFVIPLVLERPVVAPVASQPGAPFAWTYVAFPIKKGAWASQLNVSDEDIRRAATRLSGDGLTMLAFRFRADRICVAEKIQRLRTEFGDRVEAHEYESPWWQSLWPPPPHAVLTKEYDDAKNAGPDHPTRRAFATLVTFLNERLRPPF